MSLIKKIHVRVPASTSNLGPGFDCLGMALNLYNDLTLEMHSESGPASIEISGEGQDSLPRDHTNIILKAANTVIA
jgi:homoserine kinase